MAAFWYRRVIVRDHRRDVLLLREPSTEGNVIATGPYDDPGHALQYAIAAQNDPPRDAGSMDFQNLELVEANERPAPTFDEIRAELQNTGGSL